MNEYYPKKDELRFLVLSDIDIESTSLLADRIVPEDPKYDCIIVSGPFTHCEVRTDEESALVHGDLANMLAQLENIVCRVLFMCTDNDPVSLLTGQLHLTPNSVNLHARTLLLANKMFALGFTETKGNLESNKKLPKDVSRSEESDDELESLGVGVQASNSSISIIEELFDKVKSDPAGIANSNPLNKISTSDDSSTKDKEESTDNYMTEEQTNGHFGIFVLNYKFSHTLNHLLFHLPEKTRQAGISLAIIPPPVTEHGEEPHPNPVKLPQKVGNLTVISPKSLRQGGHYLEVVIKREDSNAEWAVQDINELQLSI